MRSFLVPTITNSAQFVSNSQEHSFGARPHPQPRKQPQQCKVAFSREQHSYPNDPLLLAQSLTAKSRECVNQYQDLGWHIHSSSSSSAGSPESPVAAWAQSFLVSLPRSSSSSGGIAQQQQKHGFAGNPSRSGRGGSNNGAISSSSRTNCDSWIRRIWPLDRSTVSSRVAAAASSNSSSGGGGGVSSAHVVVAATAYCSPAATTADAGSGLLDNSSSGNSSSDTDSAQQTGFMPAAVQHRNVHHRHGFEDANSSSSDSSSSWGDSQAHYAAYAVAVGADAAAATAAEDADKFAHQQQQLPHPSSPAVAASLSLSWQQQQQQRKRGSSMQQHTVAQGVDEYAKNLARFDSAVTNSASSSRPSGSRSAAGSSSGSSSDEGDWLTAVLSVSTSKLSVRSNAVLTNSLKRLASLRLGSSGAAAVEGSEGLGLTGLLDSVRARFGTFQLQQFEEVALQLAQLGYQPDEDWLEAFERHSLAVMSGGSPRLLSRLLLARTKLFGRCSASWCSSLLSHMAAQPERLTVSSWVNALWALVRLKHAPSRHFQAVFFSSSASRLDDVSPELLTNLVWSLARLQLAPSYLWWRSLVSATATVEKAFSHGQLASLVHSVALWAEPGGIAARDVQRLVDLLLFEINEQLSVMQPAELTTIMWSLGSLTGTGKLVPDYELQDRLLAAVQGQLPRLSPGQLSNLCWGLAKLEQGLPQGFAEALLLEVQAQLQGLSDSNLANVLWALARMRLGQGGALRQALWEELHTRCTTLAIQDLSTVMWSLARMQFTPPPDLLQELLDASLPQLANCDASHLTNLTWGFANLCARPGPDWLDEFEQASLQVLPTAQLPELVNLAQGFHKLGRGKMASLSWQAAVLRQVRLRFRCTGHEMSCQQILGLLKEMGVHGLELGVAVAEQSFMTEDEEGYCAVEFQPGCA